jgi:carboxypeptidase family protein
LNRIAVVLTLFLLAGSALAISAATPLSPRAARGASSTPLLSDDFAHDASLNATLWQVNGPVGSVLGPKDAGFNLVTLAPVFSSAGMEIAQVNASQEVGTIQSIESFTPPFTASAMVEGSVSNGHTFGFAISSENASSGVLVYGNLNDTNCSHLGDCGNPTTCGISADASIPPNQCYYGIDAKVAQVGGSWPHTAKLYLTPSVNVLYSLQISVDASGSAQYSVSQGGLVLGASTAQVGTGPFYVIMEQAEGSPVASPGPNQALWLSVSLTPLATTISTTTTAPAPTSLSIPIVYWLIIVLVIIVLLLIILLWYRRRNLTVRVQDAMASTPIVEASVSADGPEKLTGYTGKDGKITFKGVDKGDYAIKATATGYVPSVPLKVSVKKTTEFVVGLDRLAPISQERPEVGAPPEGPSSAVEVKPSPQGAPTAQVPTPPTQRPQTVVPTPAQGPAQPTTQPESAPAPTDQQGPELEGLGGGRIAEVVRTFKEKGAISPETALTAQELGLSRLFVRIMKRRTGRTRIFMEINGKYYLDQKALEEMK